METSNPEKIPRPKYRAVIGASPRSRGGTRHHRAGRWRRATATVATTLVATRARATLVGSANGTRVMNITDPMAPGSNVTAIKNSSWCTISSAAAAIKAQPVAANRTP